MTTRLNHLIRSLALLGVLSLASLSFSSTVFAADSQTTLQPVAQAQTAAQTQSQSNETGLLAWQRVGSPMSLTA